VHIYYVSAEGQKLSLFRKLIGEVEHDVVYIHLLFGFWYSILPLVLSKMHKSRTIIVAAHGVLGKGALGVKPTRKVIFLKLMKWTGFYRKTIFHSVTDHETVDIRTHIGPETLIREARELPRHITGKPERVEKVRGKLRVVTIARISPEKNQLFALEILQGCRSYEIHYDLIGPVHDVAYWERCQGLIASMPSNVTVTYRGSISSELILTELMQYDLMLLPTTGENFGHTILESFMAGCPVIISDQTPWKGLVENGTGRELPLADMASFRENLEFFASLGPEEYSKFTESAYQFAMAYCANPEMLDENIKLFSR
jgi:glycosyltransferase involved in cell wall biosynthesis